MFVKREFLGLGRPEDQNLKSPWRQFCRQGQYDDSGNPSHYFVLELFFKIRREITYITAKDLERLSQA